MEHKYDNLTFQVAREGLIAKDAEIERLNSELREEREAFLSRQLHDTPLIDGLRDELKMAHEVVQIRDAEIERLKVEIEMRKIAFSQSVVAERDEEIRILKAEVGFLKSEIGRMHHQLYEAREATKDGDTK